MNLISETDYKNKVIALDNEIRDAKIANAKAVICQRSKSRNIISISCRPSQCNQLTYENE